MTQPLSVETLVKINSVLLVTLMVQPVVLARLDSQLMQMEFVRRVVLQIQIAIQVAISTIVEHQFANLVLKENHLQVLQTQLLHILLLLVFLDVLLIVLDLYIRVFAIFAMHMLTLLNVGSQLLLLQLILLSSLQLILYLQSAQNYSSSSKTQIAIGSVQALAQLELKRTKRLVCVKLA